MSATFIFDYGGIGNCLPVEVLISNPVTGKECKYLGVWDTGATNTVISSKVATELALTKQGLTTLAGVSGEIEVYTVAVDIRLCKDIKAEDLDVNVAELSSEVDFLLGMDIITKGSFLVDTKESTVLTFEAN